MLVKAFGVSNHAPIVYVEANDLSNLVVIAGPNGVGKTRLSQALLECFKQPSKSQNAWLIVFATSDEERSRWGKDSLDTRVPEEAERLRLQVMSTQKRGQWKGSAYQFDSQRQTFNFPSFQWQPNLITDPAEDNIGWEFGFTPVSSRFHDTIFSILRKVNHHDQQISQLVKKRQRQGETHLQLNFADPISKFREAFALLLGPKKLPDDIALDRNDIQYVSNGQLLPMASLSSGEKEILVIVFDLLLREPEDSVIFIDEPEVHLHPELAFRLLKTLPTIGKRNQFILCTHSAEIITASLEQSVVFVTPSEGQQNQARCLNSSSSDVEFLRQLGQSLGVISLGRKIVLIEGADSSLDRQIYGAILQDMRSNLVLTPSGSRSTILQFSHSLENILDKTVWGIEFFMLADRDCSLPEQRLHELERRSTGRLRLLPRYHIENYFLDENCIATMFAGMEPEDSCYAQRNSARFEQNIFAQLIGLNRNSLVLVEAA